MQIEVAARTAELAEVNAQLRPEIAARTQAEEQLRLADRRKGEFLATLSGGISIAVRDSGIGFEPSAAAEMFDMFTQVSASRPVGEKGLGIGLALVKAFLALHGGTVEASSAGANHGSEFRIRIPGSIVIGRQAGLALNPSDIPVSNGTRCKVLVVDDNRDSADALALVLEADGCDILVGYSGQEALDLAARSRPWLGPGERQGSCKSRRFRPSLHQALGSR